MRRFNPEKELKKIQHGNRNKIIIFGFLLLIVGIIGYSFALYQVRYSKRIIYTKVSPFSNYDIDLAVYVNGVKKDTFPTKEEELTFAGLECEKEDVTTATWNETKGGLDLFTSGPNKCNVIFNLVKDFNYRGSIEEYVVPKTGTYKLEVWGAQGGNGVSPGGYGAYSTGNIYLEKDTKLYIGIGGAGYGNGQHAVRAGGFNGGGNATSCTDVNTSQASGGGATHIALLNGVLSSLENNLEDILIIAGGGGGAAYNSALYVNNIFTAGSGGGANGGMGVHTQYGGTYYSYGGTQNGPGEDCTNYCGSFGQGGSSFAGAGGGGLYGGNASDGYSGGGGSGYIGNDLLTDKVMYCYKCEENNEIDTKTIPTENVNANPLSMYVKQGNGYARITLIKETIEE